jgi:hypothetical protein
MESSLQIPRLPEMVELLLDNGADPNGEYAGRTVWETFLRSAESSSSIPANLPAILKTLILHGADPRPTISQSISQDTRTPLKLCQYLFGRPEHVDGDLQKFETGMIEVIRLLVAREAQSRNQEMDLIHELVGGNSTNGGGLIPIENLERGPSPKLGRKGKQAEGSSRMSRFKARLERLKGPS